MNDTTSFRDLFSGTTSKITALAVVAALIMSVFAGPVGAAVTNYTTEAGNASDAQISVSVADASADDSDPSTHEIKYRISEDGGTYDATIDKVEFQDSSGNVVSSIQPAATVSAGTESEFTAGPHPGDSMTSGTMVVYYTHNGTSYTLNVAVDIDGDGDGYVDSADQYPTIAAQPTVHDVTYDSDGDGNDDQFADQAEVTFNSSTGNSTVQILADTDGDGNFETSVMTKEIDTSSTTTVSADVSSLDASSVMIETHGPATVDTRGLVYAADADGDRIADSNDAYPNTAEKTWTVTRTDGESVYSGLVEAHNSSNGNVVELTVYGVNQTDGTSTELVTKTVEVGSDTELVEANVGDGNRTYDAYTVEFHGNATHVNSGITYEGGGGGSGSTDGATGLPVEVIFGGVLVLLVGGIVLLAGRDE